MKSRRARLEKLGEKMANEHDLMLNHRFHYKAGFNSALDLLMPVVESADFYHKLDRGWGQVIREIEKLDKRLSEMEGEG